MSPRLLVVLVAALNLGGGLALGVVIGRHTLPAELPQSPPPDLPALADELGLPPERAAKVREQLASCGPRFEALMDETRPRFRALHDAFMAELSAILTPDEMRRLIDAFKSRYGGFPAR